MSAVARIIPCFFLAVWLAACAHTPDAPASPGKCMPYSRILLGQSDISNGGLMAADYHLADCSNMPPAPGKPSGDCPINPNNPGGAQDKPCTRPKGV